MHYVISDLHGCYDEYIKMLELIHFGEQDILYVNGDIIDRGESGIKILQHMMRRKNIVPIIGNHEWEALPGLASRIGIQKPVGKLDFVELDFYYMHATTAEEFFGLSEEEREEIVDYISDFATYIELTVNQRIYFITHAGFNWDKFAPEKKMSDYEIASLVWSETDYSKVYFPDKILITGHTPTSLIDEEYTGRIFRGNNHIAIDCGCVFGDGLGCFCLETGEEFYVSSQKRSDLVGKRL